MKTGNIRVILGRTAARAAVAGLLLLAGALPGFAQNFDAQPQDIEFEIINATTGEPGTVARMTIEYVTARRNNVADFAPEGSAFVATGVPLIDSGEYIITVWHRDVPYWWSKRGRDLAGGKVTLHVFDTTSVLDGVSITGMNLVIRRQESLLRLEYMLQVTNSAQPQITVVGSPATFELALPGDASEISASYTRGPDPTPIPVDSPGPGSGFSLPLTPGNNAIRLEAVVPWSEGMELPVGSNLPVTSWSVLASPSWLEVGSTDIEENDSEKVEGFRRFAGFPLDAGESVDLRLNSGEPGAGAEEDLFTQEAPSEQETPASGGAAESKGGMTLPLIFVGVLIIVVILAAARRRS